MKKTMLAAVAVLALLCGATPFAHATYDGVPSTGSFAVINVSSLAAATATGSLVVIDTTGSKGSSVNLGAYTLIEGRDWRVGATSMTAAISLTAAINANDNIPVDAAYALGDASILLTAVSPGTLYNAFGLKSSTPTALSVSAAHLTGGQNNAVVSINAVGLVQGRDWFIQDVSSNTAINLAASINHSGTLKNQVEAVWLGGSSSTVYLRAAVSPVLYTLVTSDPADLSVTGTAITPASGSTTMTGGSAGNLARSTCFLGMVNALPTSNYPAGCLLFLSSDPTKLYLSTQAVTGAATNAANSWLAK